jgi:eukaryotic-like serine/threonine-protein kinase
MPPLPADSAQPLQAGTMVGHYRIEMLLGSGGMADVYYALDQQLDRPIALKILRPHLAADTTYLQRFQQEAKAAAALVHPNIVQIYSVGQAGELRYIAQEFVPGANLRQYLSLNQDLKNSQPLAEPSDKNRAGGDNAGGTGGNGNGSPEPERHAINDRQLPIDETLSILLQILAALNKSASLGIVHRDIKPENIMLTSDGDVKVADFGLARLALGDDPRLTNAGVTLGTPMYMSPEQIQGDLVDIRSDLYSLGVTCFHMIYGRPPYQGDTPLALAMKHVQACLPDFDNLRSDVPESLKLMLRQLLQKSPDERLLSPMQVLDFLHQHRRGDLAEYWPERTIPMPGVDQSIPSTSHATQKLQALLRSPPAQLPWQRLLIPLALLAWSSALIWFGYRIFREQWTSPEQMLVTTEEVFKGIARQTDVKQQYEWALLDRTSGRIAKWEAVEQYFPKSENPLNRMYVGLSHLQLARAYQEAGEPELASRHLNMIIDDAQMQLLVQAYAWLQQASIEHARGDKAKVQSAVDQALRLRDQLSKNKKDVEQLDHAVRLMPPDIELYWTPNPTDS